MKFNFYHFLEKNQFLLPAGMILLTLVTLTLTLIPAEALGQNKIWSYDKLGHLGLFGSWTYWLGLYYTVLKQEPLNLWGVFFVGFSFGGIIELLQYILPLNRHADPMDLFFDGLGCLIAILLLHGTLPKKKIFTFFDIT